MANDEMRASKQKQRDTIKVLLGCGCAVNRDNRMRQSTKKEKHTSSWLNDYFGRHLPSNYSRSLRASAATHLDKQASPSSRLKVGSRSGDAAESKSTRITAARAVTKAILMMRDSTWKIAYLSNTGVTQRVSGAESRRPDGGLMHKDGTAAQWVVEMFQQTDQRKTKWIPFQVLRVTAKEVSDLPQSELEKPLPVLRSSYIMALDARAIA